MASAHPTRESFAELWVETDGVEYVRAMARGELPRAPHVELLDYRIAEVEAGRVELTWKVPRALLNPVGIAHGGFLAAILDDAGGLACASRYPRFVPQMTQELRTDFVRPVPADAAHTVIGEVVRGGRSSNLAEARLLDADGRILARAVGTFVPNRRVIPRDRWDEAGL